MEIQRMEVTLPSGVKQEQNSQVLIKKCRYLEASGCKGMCVNMCKVRRSCVCSPHARVISSAAHPCPSPPAFPIL